MALIWLLLIRRWMIQHSGLEGEWFCVQGKGPSAGHKVNDFVSQQESFCYLTTDHLLVKGWVILCPQLLTNLLGKGQVILCLWPQTVYWSKGKCVLNPDMSEDHPFVTRRLILCPQLLINLLVRVWVILCLWPQTVCCVPRPDMADGHPYVTRWLILCPRGPTGVAPCVLDNTHSENKLKAT